MRSLLTTIGLTLLGTASFLAIGLGAYEGGMLFFVQPDPDEFPVLGIDVSHHQGQIDWAGVAGEPVRFAYIKATEGGDWTDPRFAENWSASGEMGLRRGAYHYFTLCRSGRDQVAHVVATIPNDAGALPIAIDAEFGGNCAARPARGWVRSELDVLIEGITEHYGRAPILYATNEFHERYLDEYRADVLRWRRNLWERPSGSAAVWQFRNRARVAGIVGPVDLNVATQAIFAE